MLEFRSKLDSTKNSKKGKLYQSTTQDSQKDQDSPKNWMIFFKQRCFCAFLRVSQIFSRFLPRNGSMKEVVQF